MNRDGDMNGMLRDCVVLRSEAMKQCDNAMDRDDVGGSDRVKRLRYEGGVGDTKGDQEKVKRLRTDTNGLIRDRGVTETEKGSRVLKDEMKKQNVDGNTDDSDESKETDDNNLIEILKSDLILVKKTEEKYSNKNFKPKRYTKKQLLDKIKPYFGILAKILDGEIDSYFYTIAQHEMNKSKFNTIQAFEFSNLPLNKLQCGFLGKKRSMIVKQKIYLKFETKLANSQDKLLQWFGADNFTTYVLLPEIISFMIKDDFKLSSIDKAIDLMELTTDYGLYIMDKIDVDTEDYDSDEDDDQDIKNTRQRLRISSPEPQTTTFVQDLIGISDLESD